MSLFTLAPCLGLCTYLICIYHLMSLRSTGAGPQIEFALSTAGINCRIELK